MWYEIIYSCLDGCYGNRRSILKRIQVRVTQIRCKKLYWWVGDISFIVYQPLKGHKNSMLICCAIVLIVCNDWFDAVSRYSTGFFWWITWVVARGLMKMTWWGRTGLRSSRPNFDKTMHFYARKQLVHVWTAAMEVDGRYSIGYADDSMNSDAGKRAANVMIFHSLQISHRKRVKSLC